jgi:hypothetical protein
MRLSQVTSSGVIVDERTKRSYLVTKKQVSCLLQHDTEQKQSLLWGAPSFLLTAHCVCSCLTSTQVTTCDYCPPVPRVAPRLHSLLADVRSRTVAAGPWLLQPSEAPTCTQTAQDRFRFRCFLCCCVCCEPTCPEQRVGCFRILWYKYWPFIKRLM